MKALSIRKLAKTYPGGLRALKDIDLEVGEGDFFALLGPNGAGKSTTIGIITSLINKSSGTVKVFDCDLDEEPTLAKTYIGLVPQELNFNQFESVLDIVVNQAGFYGIPRKTALQRAEKYLKQLGLWAKRDAISRTLSGGMKRRLMIARALVHEPKMLILDEPTAGVDIELRRGMWEFLQRINEAGITVILTTHYLEEAEYLCKGIAIIDKGEIIENTTIKQLIGKLQQETIILDLHSMLIELPEIENCTVTQLDANTLEITFDKRNGLNQVFAALSANGIEVESMRNKSNRLEELFMRLIHDNQSAGELV